MVSSCPFPRLTRNERGNTKNKSTLINDSIMLFTSFNFFQIEIGVWGKAPFGTFRVVGRSFVAQYKRLKDLFSSPIVVRAGEQLTDMLFKLVQNPFFLGGPIISIDISELIDRQSLGPGWVSRFVQVCWCHVLFM